MDPAGENARLSALFDQVCANTRNEPPHRQVCEILLWRGFLVDTVGTGVFLYTGSHEQDVELLKEKGFGVRQEGELPAEMMAEVSVPAPDTLTPLLKSVFTFYPDGGGLWCCQTVGRKWISFKRRHYGAKVPVRALDQGIALLVKSLPFIRAQTMFCCDGHGHSKPMISLYMDWDEKWACRVVEQLWRDEDDLQVFRSGTESDMFHPWPRRLPAEAQYRFWCGVQTMARRLMLPAVGADARRLHGQFTGPADLDDPEKTKLAESVVCEALKLTVPRYQIPAGEEARKPNRRER